jgi:GxxExxY protein
MQHAEITERVIGAAIEVHRELGPGLLESVYRNCLVTELRGCGMAFEVEKTLPVVYKGRNVGAALRLDLVVEECVVVEVKAVERMEPVHMAQLLTYLRLTRMPVGLLINFHVPMLKSGIRRAVWPPPDSVAPILPVLPDES